MAQQVVRTVGRYEIHREIGRGGMAVVYLARQTSLGRLVSRTVNVAMSRRQMREFAQL